MGLIIMGMMFVVCVIYWVKVGGWEGMEELFVVMLDYDNYMKLFGVFLGVEYINFFLFLLLFVLGDVN